VVVGTPAVRDRLDHAHPAPAGAFVREFLDDGPDRGPVDDPDAQPDVGHQAENVSINRIATMFRVTRQRISALLRDRADPPADEDPSVEI
jgi:hypothetical protein